LGGGQRRLDTGKGDFVAGDSRNVLYIPRIEWCVVERGGGLRTTIEIASLTNPSRRRRLEDVMVDTGAEYNWVPTAILIDLGIAPTRIDRFETADGDGDRILLGAYGPEGLNLRVDLVRRELVPAGPVPAAASA